MLPFEAQFQKFYLLNMNRPKWLPGENVCGSHVHQSKKEREKKHSLLLRVWPLLLVYHLVFVSSGWRMNLAHQFDLHFLRTLPTRNKYVSLKN